MNPVLDSRAGQQWSSGSKPAKAALPLDPPVTSCNHVGGRSRSRRHIASTPGISGYHRLPGAVSSVGRAPARQAGGHWFEPSTAHGLAKAFSERRGPSEASFRIWVRSGLTRMRARVVPEVDRLVLGGAWKSERCGRYCPRGSSREPLDAARRPGPEGVLRVARRGQPGGDRDHGRRRAGDELESGRGGACSGGRRRRRSDGRSTTSSSTRTSAEKDGTSPARRSREVVSTVSLVAYVRTGRSSTCR